MNNFRCAIYKPMIGEDTCFFLGKKDSHLKRSLRDKSKRQADNCVKLKLRSLSFTELRLHKIHLSYHLWNRLHIDVENWFHSNYLPYWAKYDLFKSWRTTAPLDPTSDQSAGWAKKINSKFWITQICYFRF